MKKREKLNTKMSLPYGGISFILFLFFYFINFGIERTSNSRFGVRIVRKTKLKKFQAVDGSDFYDVTSSQVGESDNCGEKKKRKKASKRNKVAPAPAKAKMKRGVKQTERSRVQQTSTLSRKVVIRITLRL